MFTITVSCLKPLLTPTKSGKPKLELGDVPAFAKGTLGVHGVNLTTDLLTGLPREKVEQLRDRADKARCACLMLIESEPQKLGDANESVGMGAVERLRRVIRAANVLGCNSAAVAVAAPDDAAALGRVVDRLRASIHGLEKLDVNVLLSPHAGLTATPDRITDLLKKVGGFRLGTFPDFQMAAAAADPVAYLRRLAPYASVVSCSTVEFVADPKVEKPAKAAAKAVVEAAAPEIEPPMKHATYDLKTMLDAITTVGFQGTLALDYRGKGDPTLGVIRSRTAFERIMSDEEGLPTDEELAELEEEFGGEEEGEEEASAEEDKD